ncbi:MAG TPA: hypothetical protein VK731_02750 [Candidatus Cybelea sp.]|jgi:hypothetical protein|nr:hypothetical protein [Candidatus Cybelea sp.]
MKTRSFKSTIGSLLTATVAVAVLAALPAQAGSGLTKVTHSDHYSKWAARPVRPTVAKAQPTVSQKQPEVQVAVMAKVPLQPAAKRSVFIHR